MIRRLLFVSWLVCAGAVPLVCQTIQPDGTANLYKVYIYSRDDADKVTRLGVNAFLRVQNGYLVQAPPAIEEQFASQGISFALIARDINRSHLTLDMRRDRQNAEKYPALFEEGTLRLYQIDPADRDRSDAWQGLAPIPANNLKIIHDEPPRLDLSVMQTMLDLDSLAGGVLVDSCQSYIERLQAFQTRWTGTDSNLASRDWLMNRLGEYGCDAVYCDTFLANHTYGGWDFVPAYNVIGVKTGTMYPDHQIIIGAHRDTYPLESPGADDNATGSAAVLEIARLLRDLDTRMTFVFILFDTEETGLFGSWHYADHAAQRGDSIVMVINMDVIGYNPGTDIVTVSQSTGNPYGALWNNLADSLPSIDLTVEVFQPTFLDGLPFEVYGYRSMDVAEHFFDPYMHTERDSATYLDFDYVTRITRASLVTAYVVDQTYVPAPWLSFTFPDGTPDIVAPNAAAVFNVGVESHAGAVMTPGSGELHYSINNGPYATAPLADVGGGLFQATLPACVCDSWIKYYLSVQESSGGLFFSADPEQPHMTATGVELAVLADYNFEERGDWYVYGNANQGLWTLFYPHGYGVNGEVALDFDGSGKCFYTGLESRPWQYAYTDVDGGTTILHSPRIDMTGGRVLVQYARWYSNNMGAAPYSDVFEIQISNDDGQTWTVAETVGPMVQASGGWFFHRFWVNDIMEPTAQMRLRFLASDLGQDSNVEAGLDALRVVRYSCGPNIEIVTDTVPDWTMGVPFNLPLESTGGYGTVSWNDKYGDLGGTGLTLSSDGILSGTPSSSGPITFTAVAIDEFGRTDEHDFSFIINVALTITTNAIPPAAVGQLYSFALSCTGGTGTKSWSDVGEALAGSGVELLSTGVLAGIPADTGTIAFTARVVDAVGAPAERSYSLVIEATYVCGDANNDQMVNVGDAVFLINHIFKGGPAPLLPEAGDANCDGFVNVGDAVYLVMHIFKGGPAPCCP